MGKRITLFFAGVLVMSLLQAGQAFSDNSATISNASQNSAATASSFVLVLGTGSSSSIGGIYTPAAGWTTTPLATSSSDAPGLAVTDAAVGVGVIRDSNSGGTLNYTIWNGTDWSPPAAISSGIATRTRPAICSKGTSAAVAFQGNDFKHYYAEYQSTWSPTAEAAGSPQSYGPVGPDIAMAGGNPTISFINQLNHVCAQTRALGAWGTTVEVGTDTNSSTTPALAALSSGPELLMVYANSSAKITYSTRTGGVWSAPTLININALTNDRVALAPTVNGGAVLAYRGQDTKLYYSLFSDGVWSSPAAVSTPNISVVATPALSPGIATASAEMVFIEPDGKAYHSRLIGSTWTVPVLVGGTALNNAALASFITYTLTVTRTGAGDVSLSPGALSAWVSNVATATYTSGGVDLTANPASCSVFSSWGGACVGYNTPTCMVTMTADQNVTITFTSSGMAWNYTSGRRDDTLQTAFDSISEATAQQELRMRAQSSSEEITMSKAVTLTLRGGYDCDYLGNISGGRTGIKKFTIRGGTLIVENIEINN